jgi:FkbM family methyltransferase|tara:strand:- start:2175 stop:2855 length:681 start_codon:yes stop_codon:yes gene_type:complete
MKNFNQFEWGPIDSTIKDLLIKETNIGTYEKKFQVKEGDIVVDIGASVGTFTYSILDKNPKHVFCLEPSKGVFPHLVKNTLGYPVTQINKAIAKGNGTTDALLDPVYGNKNNYYETITFSTFINLFNIKNIDFLKLDCEGGEYDIFTDENIDFLLNNVGCIVGEFHLGWYYEKPLFRNLRDKYLSRFEKVTVHSLDYPEPVDITWDLWNDHFIDFYDQVIIHISNE